MKLFEIRDSEQDMSIGVLQYYERSRAFIIELVQNLDEWTAPLLFTAYVKKGIFTISREDSFLWVKERVIPSGRQNISSILKTHKLPAYDEMKFLEISSGICSQDNMFIRPITELPQYVTDRQRKNLKEIVLLQNRQLLCFFEDGTVKKVALAKLKETAGVEYVLENDSLYNSGQIGVGGYYVTFNDSIDIPAWALYENGTKVPLDMDDFLTFVRRNILDTSESCELLECSRQNLAYLCGEGKTNPVKENVKGNLYLKGEIQKQKW